MTQPRFPFGSLLLAASLAFGCGSGGDAASTGGVGGTRLAPGGAQDFGLFRDIVARGEIPAPETLDATGFFAEHAIGTPEATCDDAVCATASLGVLRNLLDGRTCTLVRVGLATPLSPSTVARPAHVVVLVDTSSVAAEWRDALVAPALEALFEGLNEGDTISLVAFAGTSTRVATETTSAAEALAAFSSHEGGGDRDLYAGLRDAYALAHETDESRERRLLVLTTAGTELGITSPARIVELVRAEAHEGIATSVVGFGDVADATLWSRLAASGAGNSYFVGDSAEAREIFREELATSFTPIARDVRIRLDAGNAWDVVGLYGVTDARLDGESGIASIPSLFLAGRRDGGDVMGPGMGRRGGGGALLFELMPRTALAGTDLRSVGDVTVELVDPRTGETVVQRTSVSTPFDATSIPEDGFVGDANVDKAFVVLNALVGFKSITLAVQEGDYAEALATGRALEPNLVEWLRTRPDTDVEGDLEVLRGLLSNVEADAPADTDVSQATATPRWAWD